MLGQLLRTKQANKYTEKINLMVSSKTELWEELIPEPSEINKDSELKHSGKEFFKG